MKTSRVLFAAMALLGTFPFVASQAEDAPRAPSCRQLDEDRYGEALTASDERFGELRTLLREVAPEGAEGRPEALAHLADTPPAPLLSTYIDQIVGEVERALNAPRATGRHARRVESVMYELRREAVRLRAKLNSRSPGLSGGALARKPEVLAKIDAFIRATHPLHQHFNCGWERAAYRRDARAYAERQRQRNDEAASRRSQEIGQIHGVCDGSLTSHAPPQPEAAPVEDQVCYGPNPTTMAANNVEPPARDTAADLDAGTSTSGMDAGTAR
jgi:hypothetical protein